MCGCFIILNIKSRYHLKHTMCGKKKTELNLFVINHNTSICGFSLSIRAVYSNLIRGIIILYLNQESQIMSKTIILLVDVLRNKG